MRQFFGIFLLTVAMLFIQACGLFKDQTKNNVEKTDKEKRVVKKQKNRQEPVKLSDREKLQFKTHFFDALQEKHIGNNERSIKLFKKCLKLKPDDPAVHYDLSRVLLEEGSLDSALIHAKKAVKFGDEGYWYLEHLGEVYKSRKAYAEAAKVMEKVIEKHGAGPEFYYQLANLYIRQDKLKKALSAYDRFEEEFGKNPQVINQKKRIYLQLNDVEKAAKEIKSLIEENPQKLEYYRQLASIYIANDKMDKALKVYKQMLEVSPENGKTNLALAEYYTKKGKKDKAYEYLEKAFKDPGLSIDQKVQFMLNKYFSSGFKQQDRDEAFSLAKILVDVHPNSAKSYAIYGDLLYQDGQEEAAMKQFEQALKYNKDNFAVWEQLLRIYYSKQKFEALKERSNQALTYFPNQPRLYFYNGLANKNTGELEKAVQQFKSGLQLSLNNQNLKSQFYSNIAMTYHDLKNYEESDKYFEKALNLRPQDPYILNNYSWYLALRGDSLDKAAKMSRKSLELNPENSAYLDTYGWIQYKKGDFEEALNYIGRALERSPKDAELLEHYGDVLYKMDKIDKAVQFWKKARENGGDAEKLNKKITNKRIFD